MGHLNFFLSDSCLQQIPGYTAGVDYPNYSEVPKGGSFSCQNRLPGYYADMETRCQVWHWCLHSGYQFSFLCPNGTVFNQVNYEMFKIGFSLLILLNLNCFQIGLSRL